MTNFNTLKELLDYLSHNQSEYNISNSKKRNSIIKDDEKVIRSNKFLFLNSPFRVHLNNYDDNDCELQETLKDFMKNSGLRIYLNQVEDIQKIIACLDEGEIDDYYYGE